MQKLMDSKYPSRDLDNPGYCSISSYLYEGGHHALHLDIKLNIQIHITFYIRLVRNRSISSPKMGEGIVFTPEFYFNIMSINAQLEDCLVLFSLQNELASFALQLKAVTKNYPLIIKWIDEQPV